MATPRVLVCYDETPSAPGSACTNQAWEEQPPPVLQPLTIEQAQQVGGAFFLGLLTLAVIKAILNPSMKE